MQIYSPDSNTSIVTSFPHKKFDNILALFNIAHEPSIDDIKHLTLEQVKDIMAVAIHMFLKGHLFLEELSDIANYLMNRFTHSDADQDRQIEHELFDVVLAVAELSYYIRTNSDSTLNTFRKRMFNFYERNKDRVPAELQSKDPEWKPEFLEDKS
jgi:hypothetical protein